MAMVILLSITGLIAGTLGGLLGIGGCVIMLPALVFVFRYPLPIAIGTTVTAVILTATSGAIGHIRLKNVDYSTVSGAFKLYQGVVDVIAAICLGVGTIIGAQIGARLTKIVPPWAIKAIFGFVFLYVSLKFIYQGIII